MWPSYMNRTQRERRIHSEFPRFHTHSDIFHFGNAITYVLRAINVVKRTYSIQKWTMLICSSLWQYTLLLSLNFCWKILYFFVTSFSFFHQLSRRIYFDIPAENHRIHLLHANCETNKNTKKMLMVNVAKMSNPKLETTVHYALDSKFKCSSK